MSLPPEPMEAPAVEMPITVLLNAGSGRSSKKSELSAIERVLTATERDVRLLRARRPRDLIALAQGAARERPGALVAAGGDGTLNAVASVALAHALPFGVIPLGTFNYFARGLGIPTDVESAARVITEGRTRRVAVGKINGLLFLNNASIGLYRRLIEQRERHKQRFGRSRSVALASGLVTLLSAHRTYRLRLEIDGKPLILASPSVFFGRSALQMEQLGLDEAACIERGELAVLAPRDTGKTGILSLILRGAFARLESAKNLAQYCGRRVEVDWLDGRPRHIRIAVDGELADCSLPLVVESIPDALQVIVPER